LAVAAGELKHYIGSVVPTSNAEPQFISTYVYDPDHEHQLEARLNQVNTYMTGARSCPHRRDPYWCRECDGLGVVVLKQLQNMMHTVNPHVRSFVYAQQLAEELCNSAGVDLEDVQIHINTASHSEHHKGAMNKPSSSEIAVLAPDTGGGDGNSSRDLVMKCKAGGVMRMKETNPLYDPLKYPLLHPYGDYGWGLEIPFYDSTRRGNVTCLNFYQYRLAWRNEAKHFNTLHYGSKLFQEYCCDHYAIKQQQDLQYLREHQNELRADTYAGLTDAVSNDDGMNAGKRVILPSSFIGSERDFNQQYQNGMALHREFGTASLFHTFTANTRSGNVAKALPPGFNAVDRPDIVSRVFRQQVKWFIDLIRERGYYGHAVADVHVIEFQKRGLPHIHLLIILAPEDRINADEIDCVVSAEVPPESEPERRQKVVSTMVHGPCGAHFPDAPCMVDGKCSKHFPKQFNSESHYVENSNYAEYRRREFDDDGNEIQFEVYTGRWCSECQSTSCTLDNRWIVPYAVGEIFQFMDCHWNVQLNTSIGTIKYLYQYLYKGADKAEVMHTACSVGATILTKCACRFRSIETTLMKLSAS